jgi:hypothetical protein
MMYVIGNMTGLLETVKLVQHIVVDTDGLQDLSLGHDGYGDGALNTIDEFQIKHVVTLLEILL